MQGISWQEIKIWIFCLSQLFSHLMVIEETGYSWNFCVWSWVCGHEDWRGGLEGLEVRVENDGCVIGWIWSMGITCQWSITLRGLTHIWGRSPTSYATTMLSGRLWQWVNAWLDTFNLLKFLLILLPSWSLKDRKGITLLGSCFMIFVTIYVMKGLH